MDRRTDAGTWVELQTIGRATSVRCGAAASYRKHVERCTVNAGSRDTNVSTFKVRLRRKLWFRGKVTDARLDPLEKRLEKAFLPL